MTRSHQRKNSSPGIPLWHAVVATGLLRGAVLLAGCSGCNSPVTGLTSSEPGSSANPGKASGSARVTYRPEVAMLEPADTVQAMRGVSTTGDGYLHDFDTLIDTAVTRGSLSQMQGAFKNANGSVDIEWAIGQSKPGGDGKSVRIDFPSIVSASLAFRSISVSWAPSSCSQPPWVPPRRPLEVPLALSQNVLPRKRLNV